MPPELQRLLDELLSGDDARSEAAATQFKEHGPEALASLIDLCESSNWGIRWWAVRALAEFDAPGAGAPLIRALDDPHPAVRQCAALSLRLRPAPGAIPALIQTLRDSDRMAARLACDALVESGKAAIPALAAASQDSDPKVRIEAVRALSRIGDPAAIGPLFRCLDDASTIVVHYAEEGLDRLGVGMAFFSP